jgi:hypothetical protein
MGASTKNKALFMAINVPFRSDTPAVCLNLALSPKCAAQVQPGRPATMEAPASGAEPRCDS